MFQFSAFAYRIAVWHAFSMPGCPIRKPADQFVCADPRGLSQLVASYFASGSLGIHRGLLSTFFRPAVLMPAAGLLAQYPAILAPETAYAVLFAVILFPNLYVKERSSARPYTRKIASPGT